MLQRYFHQTLSLGLLGVKQHGSTRYVTTTKGLNFLEKWRELAELFDSEHTPVY